MGIFYFPLVVLVLGSAAIALTLGFLCLRRRTQPGAVFLAVLMFAIAWWSLADSGSMLLQDWGWKLTAARMKYFGIVPAPLALAGFALQYTHRQYLLTKRNILLACIVPILVLAGICTDSWHHLFYARAYLLAHDGWSSVEVSYGPLFWVHSAYSYLVLASGVILLFVTQLHATHAYRDQLRTILLAAMIPWAGNVLHLTLLNSLPIDVTPLTFLVTGLSMYIAGLPMRLFENAPIAWRAVIESMQDGVLLLDAEHRILDMNTILERWMGNEAAQFRYHSLAEIFPEEVVAWIQESRNHNTVLEVSLAFQNQPCMVEIRSLCVNDPNDRAGIQVLTLRDVNERNAMNRALSDALDLNQRIISASEVGILAFNEVGDCVLANNAAALTTGLDADQTLRANFRSIPGWQSSGLMIASEAVLSTGEPLRGLFCMPVSSNGHHPVPVRERFLECQLTTFVSNGQKHLLLLSHDRTDRRLAEEELQRDIAARMRLEKELEEAKALLEEAFQQSPAPMLLLSSPEGIVELINPACEQGLHIADPMSLIGHSIQNARMNWHVHGADGHVLSSEYSPLSIVLNGGTLNNVEYQLHFEDGSIGWIIINATPICNKEGKQIAALMVFVDITERKRSEQAEREQRIAAEAFRDTAAILNSTIQLDNVLTLVLNNIERVVPHDAAHVILFEVGQKTINRSRFRGYTGDEENMALSLSMSIASLPEWCGLENRLQPVFIADVNQAPAWAKVSTFTRLRAFLTIPIQFQNRPIGLITLASVTAGFFNQVHASRLQVFVDQASIAIENARLYSEVQNLTLTDELTHVHNYRGFLELGQREFDRARRFQRPLCLLFFDIDHFRDFNNRYSHNIGNLVLQAIAGAARSIMRAVDLLARYGGEEFVVILPETDLKNAVQIAERLRREVEKTYVSTHFGQLSITVSVGAAELTPDVANLSAFIDRANMAEHVAKEQGRNRVAAFPGD